MDFSTLLAEGQEVVAPQAVDVGDAPHPALLDQDVDHRLPQPVDVHAGLARRNAAPGGAPAPGIRSWGSAAPPRPRPARPACRRRGISSGTRTARTGASCAARFTPTTAGMTSPAFSTNTMSPTRMSLRAISSWLCRVARATVVPARRTGSSSATGVRTPVPPDLDRDRRGASSRRARPRTCRPSPSGGPCSCSRPPAAGQSESSFTTAPSVA